MSTIITLSVVIPVYNGSMTIVQALDSVLGQTLPPVEVVIVDDGSTDQTACLVRNFLQSRAPRGWVLLRQTNEGPAAARDAGIRLARGSHVALLDADDIWSPEKLEESVRLLDAHGLDLLGAGLKARSGNPEWCLANKYSMLFRNPFFTSTTVFSRDAYVDVGGFDRTQCYSEDYKLWLAFVWSGKRCGLMGRPYAIYRPASETVHSGMSSKLWRMQSSELGNFSWLHRSGKLSWAWCCLAQAVSWLKFFRRLAMRR